MITLTRDYDVFTYNDQGVGIVIVVKQIDATRHYDFGAHITVMATSDNGVWDTIKENRTGTWHELYKSRSGMVTQTAREALRKAIVADLLGNDKEGDPGLKNTFGLGHPVITNDWRWTVRDACETIKDLYYAGEPLINPYDGDEEEDDTWIIPNLITRDINVVYGQSGSGKSMFALIAGECIHHGVDFSGLRTIKGRVLLLDYETTVQKIRRRLRRVDSGLGVESDSPMLYMPAKIPLAQMLEGLQTRILEQNIDFIIVDSLARAVGGPITDEVGVGAMFQAIRQLELPCLVIHHTNRSDDYYGSPFIRAYARSLWRLRSSKNEGIGQLSIQLEQEKENDGPGVGNVTFLMDFIGDPADPEQVVLAPQHPSMVPEFQGRASLREQLVWKLDETPHHKIPVNWLLDILKLRKTEAKPRLTPAEDSKASTLRNILWALRNNTARYKTLAKEVNIRKDAQGQEWLCRLSDLGQDDNWGWNEPTEDKEVQSRYDPEPPITETFTGLPETNTATETPLTPIVSDVSTVSAVEDTVASNGHLVDAALNMGIVLHEEPVKRRTVRDI